MTRDEKVFFQQLGTRVAALRLDAGYLTLVSATLDQFYLHKAVGY